MEAYLPPRYYEPQSDIFAFSFVMGFAMFVLLAGYKVATYSTITKISPEIGMTKREPQDLVRKVVRNEVEIIKRYMAARESLLDEAIDTVHQHEARIAALEENYDKAVEEMGVLRASMSSPISNNPPATSLVQSPRSECSSWAPSYHPYNSEDGSINGIEDHVSELRVPLSPGQVPEIYSPQFALALKDELAESGGWGLGAEASSDDSDGNITDQDAGGETDDGHDEPETSSPCPGAPKVSRTPIRPLSKCKTRGIGTLQV